MRLALDIAERESIPGMAVWARLELATPAFGGQYSVQLSYQTTIYGAG